MVKMIILLLLSKMLLKHQICHSFSKMYISLLNQKGLKKNDGLEMFMTRS